MNTGENDYSGTEDFDNFYPVIIELPDDLIDKVEKLAASYPRYGINGTYALLLYKGLSAIEKGEDLDQI